MHASKESVIAKESVLVSTKAQAITCDQKTKENGCGLTQKLTITVLKQDRVTRDLLQKSLKEVAKESVVVSTKGYPTRRIKDQQ